jgi:hypothetical protein
MKRIPRRLRWLVALVSGVVLLVAGYLVVSGPPDWAVPGDGAQDRADRPVIRSLGTGTPAPPGRGKAPLARARPPAVAAETAPAGRSGPCPAFPAFPDQGCTGWRHTGVSLRTCPSTVTEDGASLDGCRFPGGVTIQARDVTITRSLIEGLVEPHGSLLNLTLVDVEIDGTGQPDPHGEAAIGNGDYTCIRCHIHSTGRGANLDRNVRIEDSYLHGFVYTDGVHQTAIGSNGGSGFTIVHNNLECSTEGCSAALSLYGDFFPIEDALIQHNLFNTTGSFCTYAGSVEGKPFPVGTGIRYLDNRFGSKYHPQCGIYGPVTSWGQHEGNVWRGNVWQDGSGPVTP